MKSTPAKRRDSYSHGVEVGGGPADQSKDGNHQGWEASDSPPKDQGKPYLLAFAATFFFDIGAHTSLLIMKSRNNVPGSVRVPP